MSEKADIFSFGVVLWEIITLERPTWRGNLRPVRHAPLPSDAFHEECHCAAAASQTMLMLCRNYMLRGVSRCRPAWPRCMH